MYDTSCNGTWLLMENSYENKQWHSSYRNAYSASDIHQYLNSNFLNLIESSVREKIIEAKIPYCVGNDNDTVYDGSNGLSAKIFLLSRTEVGATQSGRPIEGQKVSYFVEGAQYGNTEANNRRIALLNGNPSRWWLRTPGAGVVNADVVESTGRVGALQCTYIHGIRPAFILPSSIPTYNGFFSNTAPTSPTNITLPDEIKNDTTYTVSWSASTDAEGNLKGYKLERTGNSGASWTQVYDGTLTHTTDSIPYRVADAVQYRVKAYDEEGLESGWHHSAQKGVLNNKPHSIACSLTGDIGVRNDGFSVPYTVTDPDDSPVTVTEMLDDTVLRTYAPVLGEQNMLELSAADFVSVLNGPHTIKITATDDYNESAQHVITFTKAVGEMEFTLAAPLPSADMIQMGIIGINGVVPNGAVLTVEACNNGFDAVPTWENVTAVVLDNRKFFYANTVKTAERWGFNLRIKGERNGAAGDFIIYGVGGNFE